MTNNKEEILYNHGISENEFWSPKEVYKAMDEYAKQVAVEFHKFANKQEMKRWILEEPNPTIEQLYSLWEQTKK